MATLRVSVLSFLCVSLCVGAAWRWRVASSSAEALRRFSSGDLQSECDEGEVDPYTGRPATTSQPKPQNQRPTSQGKPITYTEFINKKPFVYLGLACLT